MKLFIAFLLVAVAAADKLQNNYLPPLSAQSAGGSSNFLSTPFRSSSHSASFGSPTFKSYSSSFGPAFPQAQTYSAPAALYNAPVASYKQISGPVIPILRLDNDNSGDGSYKFQYETGNHISHQESGHLKAADLSEVHGAFSYQSPEGQTISLNYVADENGFHPTGDHLPTPPPVPQEILKSLQQNAAEEARGIVDDGSYREESSSYAGQYSGSSIGNQYLAPQVRSQAVIPKINNQYLAPRVSSQYLPPGNNGGYRY